MDRSSFGYLFDLILALRSHGVPLSCLNLGAFTTKEQAWIKTGYEAKLSDLLSFKPALTTEIVEAA